MRSSLPLALAATVAVLALDARGAGAQASSTTSTTTTTVTTTSPGPSVGDLAPDFSLAWADGSGAKAKPVALRDLKGKVVVVAFDP